MTHKLVWNDKLQFEWYLNDRENSKKWQAKKKKKKKSQPTNSTVIWLPRDPVLWSAIIVMVMDKIDMYMPKQMTLYEKFRLLESISGS